MASVPDEEALDELAGGRGDVLGRVLWLAVLDLLVDAVWVEVVERREAGHTDKTAADTQISLRPLAW